MKTGTRFGAADGGRVTFAGYRSGYGYLVIINHGANMETRYAHLSKILVSKGDRLYKNEQIALSGNTGVSTGPHLHFEIRKSGVPQNPRDYVKL
jgi:murein DD-endopeptidase MepM/ murein hydrolase activator NlpD